MKHSSLLSVLLAGVVLAQDALAYTAESNYWAERKAQAVAQNQTSKNLVSAALPPSRLPIHSQTFPGLSEPRKPHFPAFLQNRLDPLLKNLPRALGTLRQVVVPKDSPIGQAGPVIIHIQDVHMNLEAQENIGKTVESLMAQGRVDLLALEGTFGPLDMERFKNFERPAIIREVAGYLLRENKISGPVHAALTGGKSVPPVVGVDDPGHHNANVQAYRLSAPRAAEMKEKLSAISRQISMEKQENLHPALLSFHEGVESYHRGVLSLGEHVARLASLGEKLPPSLLSFQKALHIEATLDFTAVEKERGQVLERLVGKLGAGEQALLLNAGLAHKQGRISYAAFYDFLEKTCAKNGVNLVRYPHVKAYIEYVMLADRVEPEGLYRETRALEEKVYGALIKNEAERKIIRQSRLLSLTEKLLDFSLTAEEWGEYEKLKKDAGAPALDFNSFESFYKEARLRDAAMATNLLAAMEKNNAKTAVLVAGGFHASGMADRLSKAGAVTLSFAPKLTRVESAEGSSYLSVFTREKTPLEKLAQGEKLFLAPEGGGFPDAVSRYELPLRSVAVGLKGRADLPSHVIYEKISGGLGRLVEARLEASRALVAVSMSGQPLQFAVPTGSGDVHVMPVDVRKHGPGTPHITQPMDPQRNDPENLWALTGLPIKASYDRLKPGSNTILVINTLLESLRNPSRERQASAQKHLRSILSHHPLEILRLLPWAADPQQQVSETAYDLLMRIALAHAGHPVFAQGIAPGLAGAMTDRSDAQYRKKMGDAAVRLLEDWIPALSGPQGESFIAPIEILLWAKPSSFGLLLPMLMEGSAVDRVKQITQSLWRKSRSDPYVNKRMCRQLVRALGVPLDLSSEPLYQRQLMALITDLAGECSASLFAHYMLVVLAKDQPEPLRGSLASMLVQWVHGEGPRREKALQQLLWAAEAPSLWPMAHAILSRLEGELPDLRFSQEVLSAALFGSPQSPPRADGAMLLERMLSDHPRLILPAIQEIFQDPGQNGKFASVLDDPLLAVGLARGMMRAVAAPTTDAGRSMADDLLAVLAKNFGQYPVFASALSDSFEEYLSGGVPYDPSRKWYRPLAEIFMGTRLLEMETPATRVQAAISLDKFIQSSLFSSDWLMTKLSFIPEGSPQENAHVDFLVSGENSPAHLTRLFGRWLVDRSLRKLRRSASEADSQRVESILLRHPSYADLVFAHLDDRNASVAIRKIILSIWQKRFPDSQAIKIIAGKLVGLLYGKRLGQAGFQELVALINEIAENFSASLLSHYILVAIARDESGVSTQTQAALLLTWVEEGGVRGTKTLQQLLWAARGNDPALWSAAHRLLSKIEQAMPELEFPGELVYPLLYDPHKMLPDEIRPHTLKILDRMLSTHPRLISQPLLDVLEKLRTTLSPTQMFSVLDVSGPQYMPIYLLTLLEWSHQDIPWVSDLAAERLVHMAQQTNDKGDAALDRLTWAALDEDRWPRAPILLKRAVAGRPGVSAPLSVSIAVEDLGQGKAAWREEARRRLEKLLGIAPEMSMAILSSFPGNNKPALITAMALVRQALPRLADRRPLFETALRVFGETVPGVPRHRRAVLRGILRDWFKEVLTQEGPIQDFMDVIMLLCGVPNRVLRRNLGDFIAKFSETLSETQYEFVWSFYLSPASGKVALEGAHFLARRMAEKPNVRERLHEQWRVFMAAGFFAAENDPAEWEKIQRMLMDELEKSAKTEEEAGLALDAVLIGLDVQAEEDWPGEASLENFHERMLELLDNVSHMSFLSDILTRRMLERVEWGSPWAQETARRLLVEWAQREERAGQIVLSTLVRRAAEDGGWPVASPLLAEALRGRPGGFNRFLESSSPWQRLAVFLERLFDEHPDLAGAFLAEALAYPTRWADALSPVMAAAPQVRETDAEAFSRGFEVFLRKAESVPLEIRSKALEAMEALTGFSHLETHFMDMVISHAAGGSSFARECMEAYRGDGQSGPRLMGRLLSAAGSLEVWQAEPNVAREIFRLHPNVRHPDVLDAITDRLLNEDPLVVSAAENLWHQTIDLWKAGPPANWLHPVRRLVEVAVNRWAMAPRGAPDGAAETFLTRVFAEMPEARGLLAQAVARTAPPERAYRLLAVWRGVDAGAVDVYLPKRAALRQNHMSGEAEPASTDAILDNSNRLIKAVARNEPSAAPALLALCVEQAGNPQFWKALAKQAARAAGTTDGITAMRPWIDRLPSPYPGAIAGELLIVQEHPKTQPAVRAALESLLKSWGQEDTERGRSVRQVVEEAAWKGKKYAKSILPALTPVMGLQKVLGLDADTWDRLYGPEVQSQFDGLLKAAGGMPADQAQDVLRQSFEILPSWNELRQMLLDKLAEIGAAVFLSKANGAGEGTGEPLIGKGMNADDVLKIDLIRWESQSGFRELLDALKARIEEMPDSWKKRVLLQTLEDFRAGGTPENPRTMGVFPAIYENRDRWSLAFGVPSRIGLAKEFLNPNSPFYKHRMEALFHEIYHAAFGPGPEVHAEAVLASARLFWRMDNLKIHQAGGNYEKIVISRSNGLRITINEWRSKLEMNDVEAAIREARWWEGLVGFDAIYGRSHDSVSYMSLYRRLAGNLPETLESTITESISRTPADGNSKSAEAEWVDMVDRLTQSGYLAAALLVFSVLSPIISQESRARLVAGLSEAIGGSPSFGLRHALSARLDAIPGWRDRSAAVAASEEIEQRIAPSERKPRKKVEVHPEQRPSKPLSHWLDDLPLHLIVPVADASLFGWQVDWFPDLSKDHAEAPAEPGWVIEVTNKSRRNAFPGQEVDRLKVYWPQDGAGPWEAFIFEKGEKLFLPSNGNLAQLSADQRAASVRGLLRVWLMGPAPEIPILGRPEMPRGLFGRFNWPGVVVQLVYDRGVVKRDRIGTLFQWDDRGPIGEFYWAVGKPSWNGMRLPLTQGKPPALLSNHDWWDWLTRLPVGDAPVTVKDAVEKPDEEMDPDSDEGAGTDTRLKGEPTLNDDARLFQGLGERSFSRTLQELSEAGLDWQNPERPKFLKWFLDEADRNPGMLWRENSRKAWLILNAALKSSSDINQALAQAVEAASAATPQQSSARKRESFAERLKRVGLNGSSEKDGPPAARQRNQEEPLIGKGFGVKDVMAIVLTPWFEGPYKTEFQEMFKRVRAEIEEDKDNPLQNELLDALDEFVSGGRQDAPRIIGTFPSIYKNRLNFSLAFGTLPRIGMADEFFDPESPLSRHRDQAFYHELYHAVLGPGPKVHKMAIRASARIYWKLSPDGMTFKKLISHERNEFRSDINQWRREQEEDLVGRYVGLHRYGYLRDAKDERGRLRQRLHELENENRVDPKVPFKADLLSARGQNHHAIALMRRGIADAGGERWKGALLRIDNKIKEIERSYGPQIADMLLDLISEMEGGLPFSLYERYVLDLEHGLLHSLDVYDWAFRLISASIRPWDYPLLFLPISPEMGVSSRAKKKAAALAGGKGSIGRLLYECLARIALYHDFTSLPNKSARRFHHVHAAKFAKNFMERLNVNGNRRYTEAVINIIVEGCFRHRGEHYPGPITGLERLIVDADGLAVGAERLLAIENPPFIFRAMPIVYRGYTMERPKLSREGHFVHEVLDHMDRFGYLLFYLIYRTDPVNYYSDAAARMVAPMYSQWREEVVSGLQKKYDFKVSAGMDPLVAEKEMAEIQRIILEFEALFRQDPAAIQAMQEKFGAPGRLLERIKNYTLRPPRMNRSLGRVPRQGINRALTLLGLVRSGRLDPFANEAMVQGLRAVDEHLVSNSVPAETVYDPYFVAGLALGLSMVASDRFEQLLLIVGAPRDFTLLDKEYVDGLITGFEPLVNKNKKGFVKGYGRAASGPLAVRLAKHFVVEYYRQKDNSAQAFKVFWETLNRVEVDLGGTSSPPPETREEVMRRLNLVERNGVHVLVLPVAMAWLGPWNPFVGGILGLALAMAYLYRGKILAWLRSFWAAAREGWMEGRRRVGLADHLAEVLADVELRQGVAEYGVSPGGRAGRLQVLKQAPLAWSWAREIGRMAGAGPKIVTLLTHQRLARWAAGTGQVARLEGALGDRMLVVTPELLKEWEKAHNILAAMGPLQDGSPRQTVYIVPDEGWMAAVEKLIPPAAARAGPVRVVPASRAYPGLEMEDFSLFMAREISPALAAQGVSLNANAPLLFFTPEGLLLDPTGTENDEIFNSARFLLISLTLNRLVPLGWNGVIHLFETVQAALKYA